MTEHTPEAGGGVDEWNDHIHDLLAPSIRAWLVHRGTRQAFAPRPDEGASVRALTDMLAEQLGEDITSSALGRVEAEESGVRTLVNVPEDGLTTSVIEVASYFDREGTQQYGIRTGGEETYVHAYGMLAYAGHTLFTMHAGIQTQS